MQYMDSRIVSPKEFISAIIIFNMIFQLVSFNLGPESYVISVITEHWNNFLLGSKPFFNLPPVHI
jgi:hypothetical protein